MIHPSPRLDPRRAALLAGSLLLAACGGSSGGSAPPGGDGDAGVVGDAPAGDEGDAGPGDDAATDAPAEDTSPSDDGAGPPDAPPAVPDAFALPSLVGPAWREPAAGLDAAAIQVAVALGASGQLAAAFAAFEEDGSLGIRVAAFAADGTPLAPAWRADTAAGGSANEPAVCALAGGGWAVAWSRDLKDAAPADHTLEVRFRRVAAGGGPAGPEDTRVVTGVPGNHWLADVACTPDGGFVVAGVRPDDGTSFGVFVQRFDAAGAPAGEARGVNLAVAGDQVYPALAADGAGGVAVAWDDTVGIGTPDELSTVLWRRVPPAPEALGPIRLGAGAAGKPAGGARIAVDPRGGGVLVGGVRAGVGLRLRHFAPGAATGEDLPALDGDPALGGALAWGGAEDRFVAAWLGGSGAERVMRLAAVEPTGVVAGPVTLDAGALPGYVPSVDARDGRVAAGWTVPDADAGFRVRVAVFE